MRSMIALVALALATGVAYANDVGEIKTVKGAAHVEREGKKVPVVAGHAAAPGRHHRHRRRRRRGHHVPDNSLVSVGPNSVLVIDRYRFDTTTHAGEFDASLNKGTLAVVSGKMVKQSPESMRIRTPSSDHGRARHRVRRQGRRLMRWSATTRRARPSRWPIAVARRQGAGGAGRGGARGRTGTSAPS